MQIRIEIKGDSFGGHVWNIEILLGLPPPLPLRGKAVYMDPVDDCKNRFLIYQVSYYVFNLKKYAGIYPSIWEDMFDHK